MKTKLAALLTGVVVLGGAAVADAADVATRPNAEREAVAVGRVLSSGPMILSDIQMSQTTAGHTSLQEYRIPRHYGKYIINKKKGVWPFRKYIQRTGWHVDPGAYKFPVVVKTPPGCTAGGTC